MNERERDLFSNRAYLAAIFMDPRCSILLRPNDKIEAKKHLIQIHLHLKCLRDSNRRQNTPEAEEIEHVEMDTDNNENGGSPLELLLKSKRNQLRRSQDEYKSGIESLIDEIETLELPRSKEILSFWESQAHGRLHEIAEIAKIVYSVPPTQVSVERCFSTLRFILNELRTRLSDERLEDILLLKTNSNFYSKTNNPFKLNPTL